MRPAVVTSLLGALALVVGFGVAQATGIRWLGGIVLLAGGLWCGRRWWESSGPVRAVLAVAVFGVAFVVSHPLGRVLGAWPSVLLVAALAALIAWLLTRRSARVDVRSGHEGSPG